MILRIEAENFRSFDKLAYTVNNVGLASIEGYWNQDPMRSNGCGKCLPADTKLKHAITGEYDTIEHWYTRVAAGETLFIWGLNADWTLSPTKVTSVFSTGSKELVEIEFTDGRSLRVSTTHPIMSEFGCKKAKDFKIGDMCAGPRHLYVDAVSVAGSDLVWRPISRITPITGRHSTFDISVDNETHLYALDSVITHNSSFLTELLTWAIFGETTEGQTASDKVRDVVKTGTKSCKVTVTLPFIKWTRSQRAGNKSNKIEIEGHEYHKLADAEAHLLQLFPPKKVFSSTLVLGQGIGNRLTGWKPAERTKTLSDLFGLGIFEQAREGVRKLIRGWESSKVGANAKLQTISQQKAQVAAQAGATLAPEELTALQNEYARLRDEKVVLVDARQTADALFTVANNTWSMAIANRSTAMSRATALQNSVDGIDSMEVCDRCQRKMTKAAKDALTQSMKEELATIQNSYPNLKSAVEAAEREKQSVSSQREEILGKIEQKDHRLNEINGRIALHNQAAQTLNMFDEQEAAARQELATADAEIGYYQKLDEAFGPNGIPLRKMESVISVFNIALARICEGVWESEIFVQLTTERTLKSGGKKNEIDIIVEGANGPTYSACSPGERRRLDLTLQLALREVLLSSWKTMMPLLVCDDVVDVLDARAKVQLYENYLVPLSENNVIFVVSPESTLSRDVPRVYIHRDGAGSKVMLNEATNILQVTGLDVMQLEGAAGAQ